MTAVLEHAKTAQVLRGSVKPYDEYAALAEASYVPPHPKLVMFDLDGTLIEGHVKRDGESGPFEQVLPFETVLPLPTTIEKIRALLDADVKVAVCTNKAGVAWGHMTVADCFLKRRKVEDIYGITEVDVRLGRWRWYEAYGHKDAPNTVWGFDDPDRKPRPGMLLRAMVDLEEEPATSLYVGDMESDSEAAFRAGVPFKHANEYF